MRKSERGEVILAILVLAIVAIVTLGTLDLLLLEPQARKNYAARHNLEAGDVRAFCRLYDVRVCDLENSPALKKQLDRFLAGEPIDPPKKKDHVVVTPVIIR